MGTFHTKVAGVTKKAPDGTNRQWVIAKHVELGQRLFLIREPDNKHDSGAIGVWVVVQGLFFKKRYHIGYIAAHIAWRLAEQMDRGREVYAEVVGITGGRTQNYGVNLLIDA